MTSSFRRRLCISMDRASSILNVSPSTVRMDNIGKRDLPYHASRIIVRLLNLLDKHEPVYVPDKADQVRLNEAVVKEKRRLKRSVILNELRLSRMEQKLRPMAERHLEYEQAIGNITFLLGHEDQSDPLSAYAPLLRTRRDLFRKYIATGIIEREKLGLEIAVLKLRIELEKEMLLTL